MEKRARTVAKIMLAWAALIALRLLDLQVIEHPALRRAAEQQQTRRVESPVSRGRILDRNGLPLAITMPGYNVVINPRQVPDATVAADLLGRILNLNPPGLERRIATARDSHRGYLDVARRISDDDAQRIESLRMSWITLAHDFVRLYPGGAQAAHLLGGVDFSGHGNAGVELSMDDQLAGRPGRVREQVDPLGRPYGSVVESVSEPGRDVRLTIDTRIQYAAERALERTVVAHAATSGSVVAMNPNTGEILALANYPAFDPNARPQGDQDIQNRADATVTSPYEPGFAMAPFVLAAALETTMLRPDTIIPCGSGVMNLYGRIFHDAVAYSALPMYDVLAKSSNIGMIQIAVRVGYPNVYDYLRRFGFGDATGVELPAESRGLLRRVHVAPHIYCGDPDRL